MEYKDVLKVIVGLVSGGFLQQIIQLFSAYGRRKFFKNTDEEEVINFFERHAPEYYNDFVLPKVIENNFYINTGIRADVESIKKYTDFKKTIGATWEDISIAKSHLRVEEEGVKIRISKFEKGFGQIVFGIGLCLMIIGIVLFLFLSQSKESFLFTVSILIIPVLAGYFLAWSVNSISVAKRMEEDLKKKRKDNTE
ncbi:hypothetical protein PG357_03390 [Riemerella anatipestifer]|nr:hypothetical protein [Riemerella anatipestifer]